MQSKLTLRMNKNSIKKAKAWAKQRHISLSQAVETFFGQLPDKKSPTPPWSSWMVQLLKLSPKESSRLTDAQAMKQYRRFVEHKHQ